MGGDDGLGPGLHKVMEQSHQPKGGGERQRGVGLVHEVEARLVHPGEQYLQEALPMAELMEPTASPSCGTGCARGGFTAVAGYGQDGQPLTAESRRMLAVVRIC